MSYLCVLGGKKIERLIENQLRKIEKNCYCNRDQHPQVCPNAKIRAKPQNVVLKILLFGYFKMEFVKKNFCHIWLPHPWTFQNAKFHVKQNLQIWDIKDLIWIFLDWNLKNHQ